MSPLARLRRRAKGTAGNVYIELIPVVLILLTFAVGAVQIIVVLWAAIETSSAARTGARIVSLGGDGPTAVKAALPFHLRKGATIESYDGRGTSRDGGISVSVSVPQFVPFDIGGRRITQRAIFDPTGGS